MERTTLMGRLRQAEIAAVAAMAALLVGCAASSTRAPVEDRSAAAPRTPPVAAAAPAPAEPIPAPTITDPALKLPLGAENAGKPGYYTVKPGDTVLRIGLETGQNWRDIARWNNIENANLIEVGQVLRVAPPGVDPTIAVARPVAPTGRVETRPLDPRAASAPASAAAPAASGAAATAVAPVAAAATPVAPAALPPRGPDDDINWLWPATGAVLSGFDEARNKGLAISGKAGDPVLAAADGRVVYAGSGLRGYGNLVIVKHNNTYLTAYAHNQALLVKDDEPVRRGQRIADMGSSDAERVQLHFEIRRLGKPVDPAKLLPPR
ncbi:MAG TPA: peptidoglycan DD-metalloendopeptidase family protein [Rubrivivax sp.]